MPLDQNCLDSGSALVAASVRERPQRHAVFPRVPGQESSGYGERFGEAWRSDATAFVSRRLNTAKVAVTKLSSDDPRPGVSAPLGCEDAFLVGYHLVDYPVHEVFEEGRAAPVTALRTGQTTLYDLRREPQVRINQAIHGVYFYFPRAALNALAEQSQATRIEELHYQPGAGVDDVLMQALVGSLLPAFEKPEQANRFFVEHIMMAVAVHVAKTYGGMKPLVGPVRGGLAPWQIKRVEDTFADNVAGNPSVVDLADACGLSVSHFCRAFRRSQGLPPHRWLLKRRVDQAKSILGDPARRLSEVALSCGFSDQSHFTRVFTDLVGISPGAWRRNQYPVAA